MARIIRYRSVEVTDPNGEAMTVRLRAWSMQKLFHLTRETWSMIEEALDEIRSDKDAVTEVKIMQVILEKLLNSETKAAMIIKYSVDDPKDLKESVILEWDAVDFMNVLTEAVEMNISDELIKNFKRLLDGFKRTARSEKKKDSPKDSTQSKKSDTASMA